MKRVALATALACVAMSASAADVSVYGRVDTGLLYEDDGTDQSVTLNSGGAGASRWGLKGSEKIGDVTVGFQLESKLLSDTGESGDGKGRLFDRDAYVYVKSPYGDVRLGRSGALGGGVSGGMFAGKTTPFGMSYGNAAASKVHATESRHDNMVRYDTPRMAGLKLAAGYSFDTDSVAKDSAESTVGANDRYAAIGADYKVGNLNVVAVADMVRPADNAKEVTKAYKVAVNYKLDPVTFYFGYQMAQDAYKVGGVGKIIGGKAIAAVDSESMTAGARVAVGGGDLNFVVGYANGDNEAEEVTVKQAAIGYTYKLSKQVTLYTTASYLENETVKDEKTTSEEIKQVMAGMIYFF